jgi:hypothetical protein
MKHRTGALEKGRKREEEDERKRWNAQLIASSLDWRGNVTVILSS